MPTKKKTNDKKDAIVAAEIGAGVLAAGAAAAAGYYFYASKNAKKHRSAASKWAKGLKQDVVRQAKKVKDIDQKAIASIVDTAAAAYVGVRNVDAAQLSAAARELKTNWKELQREVAPRAKTTTASARKVAKKATAKKATKKPAKKAGKRSGA